MAYSYLKLFILSILFIGVTSIYANESIVDVFSKTNYKNEQEAVYAFLDQLMDQENYTIAINISENNLHDLLEISSDSLNLAYTYFSLGYVYLSKGDNNNSFSNLITAYKYFRSLRHEFGVALCKNNLGLLFRYQGSYDKSLEYHSEALHEFRSLDDSTGMIHALRYIGVVHRQTDNYKEALKYYQKAIKLSLAYKQEDLISIYNSLGSYYWHHKKNDSALYYYRNALKTKTTNLHQKTRYCAVINNIGNVHRGNNNYDSALYYYSKSLRNSEKNKLQNLKSINLKNLGFLYFKNKKHKEAKEALNESIILARKINLKRILQINYLLLSKITEKENDYTQALEYYKKYSQARDSAYGQKQLYLTRQYETDHLLDRSETQYAILKKNKAENELALKKQHYFEIIAISSIIVLIATIIFILFLYNTNRKATLYFEKINKMLEEKVKIRTLKLNSEVIKHKDTSKALLKAKKKAEESDKLKSAFLSNMSHEIRTPMNSIIGFSELLNEPELNEESKNKFVRLIQTNGNTLLKLIDDIIDIAKIEANQIKFNKQECNVNLLVDELNQTFKTKTNNALSFTVSKARKECSLITDEFRLRQILSNLLSNAFKFTSEGEIKLGYKIEKGKDIIFSVKDTGAGISEEGRDKIFERFRQDNFSKSQLYQGTGLGLAISKNLVEILGGRIWVESVFGKGSSFYFSIPFEEVKAKSIKTKPDKNNAGKHWQNKTILVTEDIDESFELLEVYLEPTQLNIIRATNGKDAVKIGLKENIDLILMDIQLPKMSGIEATKKIKRVKPELPIIATTAYALTDERTKCEKAGCDSFVSKPINRKKLLELVAKYLSN